MSNLNRWTTILQAHLNGLYLFWPLAKPFSTEGSQFFWLKGVALFSKLKSDHITLSLKPQLPLPDGQEQDSDGQPPTACPLVQPQPHWLLSCVPCAESFAQTSTTPTSALSWEACSQHSCRSGDSVQVRLYFQSGTYTPLRKTISRGLSSSRTQALRQLVCGTHKS